MAEDKRIPVQQIPNTAPVPLAYTGTGGDTVQDVGAVFSQVVLNANFADCAARINTLSELVQTLIDKQNEILRAHKIGDGPK